MEHIEFIPRHFFQGLQYQWQGQEVAGGVQEQATMGEARVVFDFGRMCEEEGGARGVT